MKKVCKGLKWCLDFRNQAALHTFKKSLHGVCGAYFFHFISIAQDEDPESQSNQAKRLQGLKNSLKKHNINLEVGYSATLHDREIRFNNGWIIKIGRGLDYFKAPPGKFCIGFCDFNLRECHETVIDIYLKKR